MKVLLLSGSHSRHEFMLRDIINLYDDIQFKIVVMRREDVIPKFPERDLNPSKLQKIIFKHHFDLRYKLESEYFGQNDVTIHNRLRNVEVVNVTKIEITGARFIQEITDFKADACIVMGFGMLNAQVLEVIPNESINIHLGLSPRYRGSATLFWPTYLLDPFSTGTTFHRMNKEPDAGMIIHQTLPKFIRSLTLHETAIAAIQATKIDLSRIFQKVYDEDILESIPQPIVGKTFLVSDFRISHLEIVYKYFNDQVLNYMWPQNNILQLPNLRTPNIHSA